MDDSLPVVSFLGNGLLQQVKIVTGQCAVQSNMESLRSIDASSPHAKQLSTQMILCPKRG